MSFVKQVYAFIFGFNESIFKKNSFTNSLTEAFPLYISFLKELKFISKSKN